MLLTPSGEEAHVCTGQDRTGFGGPERTERVLLGDVPQAHGRPGLNATRGLLARTPRELPRAEHLSPELRADSKESAGPTRCALLCKTLSPAKDGATQGHRGAWKGSGAPGHRLTCCFPSELYFPPRPPPVAFAAEERGPSP